MDIPKPGSWLKPAPSAVLEVQEPKRPFVLKPHLTFRLATTPELEELLAFERQTIAENIARRKGLDK